jgi:hypothetical protein
MVSISLNTLLALAGSLEEAEKPRRARPRHDWVRGDVRCLMCARLLGRLLGTDQRRQGTQHSASNSLSFFAFRPLNPTRRIERFTPGLRMRCGDCGGTGALDDVDFFSTYDEFPVSAADDEPVRRGPGRPPRQLRPSEPPPQGVALALSTLANLPNPCPTVRAD